MTKAGVVNFCRENFFCRKTTSMPIARPCMYALKGVSALVICKFGLDRDLVAFLKAFWSIIETKKYLYAGKVSKQKLCHFWSWFKEIAPALWKSSKSLQLTKLLQLQKIEYYDTLYMADFIDAGNYIIYIHCMTLYGFWKHTWI